MSAAAEKSAKWAWFSTKSTQPVLLDAKSYPTILFNGEPTPFPEWACQGPDGGIHADARIGRIDVQVEEAPVISIEMNWTSPYGVTIVASEWLALIRDLINPDHIFIRDVICRGAILNNWHTLHGVGQPILRGKDAFEKHCSICGDSYSWTKSGEYFSNKDSDSQQVLIVNGSGLFIREDVALCRALRKPRGSFKPVLVPLRA